jgi:hypothetical protein
LDENLKPIIYNDEVKSILSNYWQVISENTDISLGRIAEQALIVPARCCLRDIATETTGKCENPNVEEKIVEKAFALLPEISQILKKRYGLE